MSEILDKFRAMNNDLSRAAREMSTAEYARLFRELERIRSRARHNEAAALHHARVEGAEAERDKWQGVVAEKDAALTEKDAVVAEQAALIAELRKQIREEG